LRSPSLLQLPNYNNVRQMTILMISWCLYISLTIIAMPTATRLSGSRLIQRICCYNMRPRPCWREKILKPLQLLLEFVRVERYPYDERLLRGYGRTGRPAPSGCPPLEPHAQLSEYWPSTRIIMTKTKAKTKTNETLAIELYTNKGSRKSAGRSTD
jgi:hypothetical protein